MIERDVTYTLEDTIRPSDDFMGALSEGATPSYQNSFQDGVDPAVVVSGTFAHRLEIGKLGHLRSGQSDYHTGTGWFLGNDNGTHKLSIGQGSGGSNYLTWDGTRLSLSGEFNLGGTNITVDDVASIQSSLDEVEAAGGGTVFLQNGTYTLTADITVPGGVTLQGISRDGVILDCANSYALKIVGTDTYSTGTLSVNNNSSTVTGSGTTWTSGMVGQYVQLDEGFYEITARNSNTEIEIDGPYIGPNLSGEDYIIGDTNWNATVRKLTVTGATGSGIVITCANEPVLDQVVSIDNGTGYDVDYCIFPRFFSCDSYDNGVGYLVQHTLGFQFQFSAISDSTTGNGITFVKCANATFFDCGSARNAADGISLQDCHDIAFLSTNVNSNTAHGIELVSGNRDIQFVAVTSDGNTSDGYKLTATSDRISLSTCSIINNGGWGVNIAASSCDNNYIIAPSFDSNTSGDIDDNGTSTSVIQDSDPPLGPFGDGSDGDVVLTTNTTLASDKFYNSLTINSGVVLNTAGYRVYVKETLTNGHYIRNNGSDGSAGLDGSAGGTGGSGGAAASGGTLDASPAGGDGGAQGATPSAGTNGTSVNPSLGSSGAAGGAGSRDEGDADGPNAGGAGGTAGTATSENMTFRSGIVTEHTITAGTPETLVDIAHFLGATSGSSLSASAGSGGGGGGENYLGTHNGGGGGGGGGAGGIVYIVARNLVNNGTIEANGGNGGNGGNGEYIDASNSAGSGGGGAGGSGGVVVLAYSTITVGTIQALGGTGGTGGVAGGSAFAASNGSDGSAGKIYRVKLSETVT